ncbi:MULTISPECIES: phospholipase D family protein [unclassified Variovorax]|jgi:putative cardiolipin synthase|uniref:phospholipase D family protein n=1 Tax=unclassified Variovorax TaxID=663243 RepID=UPI000F7F5635|nr:MULTISPECIES: phospholipase D family protein [unclassified Variovorax]RSZ39735.1 phospholipase D family protein [Variovorax sp. 553]RSZ40558.1 phospholipase D family protein [Variovorax sp. 679]
MRTLFVEDDETIGTRLVRGLARSGRSVDRVRDSLGSAILAVCIVLCLVGCASLPDEGPRVATTSLPVQGPATPLDRIATASMEAAPADISGFRLMLGLASMDTRLALLRGARRSLDLQYYHLHNDATGRLILRELRNAAQRGVRVRLLVDDLYTEEIDALLRGLDAYPNVEVRLFNPFPTRGGIATRFGLALFDFARLNRRMHNKLFVGDGVLAVAGGRNLGDIYFMRDADANFFDYDVLAAGPVVSQMSEIFDEYWNAPQVRTADSVLRRQQDPQALRDDFDRSVNGPDTPEPLPFRSVDPQGGLTLGDELQAGRVRMDFGKAQAFADSPAKAWGQMETRRLPSGAQIDTSRRLLGEAAQQASSEIVTATPYFVPGPLALQGMRRNAARGIRQILITNSLAATDEPIVHTGYRRYRDNLLRGGMQIYEIRPDADRALFSGRIGEGARVRLHTKAMVVDRQTLLLGSVNMDLRSEGLNTEFGLRIDSPALAEEARAFFSELIAHAAYQVRLKPGSEQDLEWWSVDDAVPVMVTDREPGADLWMRTKLYFQSLVVPESML